MGILRFHFNPILRQLTTFTVSMGLLLNLVMVPLFAIASVSSLDETGRGKGLVVTDNQGNKITFPASFCHVEKDDSGEENPDGKDQNCCDCECCSLRNAINLSSSHLDNLPSILYGKQVHSDLSNFSPIQVRSGPCSPRAPPSLV